MLDQIAEKTEVWDYIKAQSKTRPIFIYGMGDGAVKLLSILSSAGIIAEEVFASDDFVRDQDFCGYRVKRFSDVIDSPQNPIILLAFATFRRDVLANIYRLDKQHELLAPYMPVYGDELFTSAYLTENRADLMFVHDRLADEKSRRIFTNYINYMISGKIKYLLDDVSPREEIYHDIFCITGSEIFFDAGAYNGDTVSEFIKAAGTYQKIYAVEPGAKNYAKLVKNTAGFENITTINCALSDIAGQMGFAHKSGRQGTFRKDGMDIDIKTADEILAGREATIIKYDVESFEEKAILGSEHTIRKYKPGLIVSAYHKTDDLIRIPKTVLGINSAYSMYLRRPEYIPPWDMVYVFGD